MPYENWSSLPEGEQRKIFSNINVGYGVIFPPGLPFDFGKMLVEIDPCKMEVETPSQTSRSYSEILESEFEFKLKKFGQTSTEVNAGIKGTIEEVEVGGNASASTSTSREETTESLKKTYYLYAEYSVTQKTFNVDLESLSGKLTPTFLNKLQKAIRLDEQEVSLHAMTNLITVLNEYGWYLPNSLTVGGKITYWDSNEVAKDSSTSKLEESFKESASASIGVPLVGEGSADVTHTETSGTEHSQSSYKATSKAERRVIGGTAVGADPKETSAWLQSLDDSSKWRVVQMTMTPVLSFVPEDLYNHIRKLRSKYAPYGAVKKIAHIDVTSYFSEVEISRGEADNW